MTEPNPNPEPTIPTNPNPEPPAPNTPEARNPDGSLKDPPPLTSSDANKPVDPPKAPEAPKDPETKPEGAPEAYAEFKLPEGTIIDPAALAEAAPIFKELNLSQDQAQKLVDVQAKLMQKISTDAVNKVATMREGWRNELSNHPVMGPKLDAIKVDIGKAIESLPPDVRDPFRQAMDFTGAGDHPAFVRAFWEFAKHVNEGKPAPRGNPAPVDGPGKPSTGASAMYPHLPN